MCLYYEDDQFFVRQLFYVLPTIWSPTCLFCLLLRCWYPIRCILYCNCSWLQSFVLCYGRSRVTICLSWVSVYCIYVPYYEYRNTATNNRNSKDASFTAQDVTVPVNSLLSMNHVLFHFPFLMLPFIYLRVCCINLFS